MSVEKAEKYLKDNGVDIDKYTKKGWEEMKRFYCLCEEPQPFHQTPNKCSVCLKTVTKEHWG